MDASLRAKVCDTWIPGLRGTGEDDEGWDWPGKHEDPCYAESLEHVALIANDDVQGILLTSVPALGPHMSQLPNLVYVEYLATAPWNRPRLPPQRFKAVGPFLLRHAVRRSRKMGRDGRIGLHSEERARAFYREKMGLAPRGQDLELDLMEYFEGDEAWGDEFLAAGAR